MFAFLLSMLVYYAMQSNGADVACVAALINQMLHHMTHVLRDNLAQRFKVLR